LPDFLPNKPTVVGSRGQNPGSGMISKYGAESPKLPTLASSGGVAANTKMNKNSGMNLANKLNNPIYNKY